MDRYSVSSLIASAREALQAVAPIMERAGIPHRPAEAQHDGWEDLEAQVFRSLIGQPSELADACALASYGFSLETYSDKSFVNVADEGAEMLALVRFHSAAESFDSLLAARLETETLAVTGTAIVAFEHARFALCANKYGVLRPFAYLSY